MTASTLEQVRERRQRHLLPEFQRTRSQRGSSSPETIENWDSMQHLNLVLAIEEKFGLQLEPEDIEQMKSIGAVAAMVEKSCSPPRAKIRIRASL